MKFKSALWINTITNNKIHSNWITREIFKHSCILCINIKSLFYCFFRSDSLVITVNSFLCFTFFILLIILPIIYYIKVWHMSQKSFPKFFAVFEKTLYLYCLTFFPSSFFFFFSLSSFIWYAYLNHITSLQRDKWWSLAKSIFPEFPNFIYKSNQNKLYCYGYNKI